MSTKGYVLNGVYYKAEEAPLHLMQAPQQSTWKEWDHDRQRQEHAADIVQPFKQGKPNQEFIDLYPEAAIDYGFVSNGTDSST